MKQAGLDLDLRTKKTRKQVVPNAAFPDIGIATGCIS